MPASASLRQCSTTSGSTGIQGTAEISQVLLNCVLASVFSPCRLAISQLRVARGPGPTTDMEYSPTVVLTPPRFTVCDHSLMLRTELSDGSFGISASARGVPH